MNRLSSFFRFHQVNRFRPHYANNIFFTMNNNSLSRQRFRVKSTQCVKTNKTIIINMGNEKTNFVHVCRYHCFFGCFPFFYSDNIAHCIYFYTIDKRTNLFNYKFSNFLLKTRSSGNFTNLFQQFYINHLSVYFSKETVIGTVQK